MVLLAVRFLDGDYRRSRRCALALSAAPAVVAERLWGGTPDAGRSVTAETKRHLGSAVGLHLGPTRHWKDPTGEHVAGGCIARWWRANPSGCSDQSSRRYPCDAGRGAPSRT